MMDIKFKANKKWMTVFSLLSLGIMLRFFAMSLGSNFDFESYCIVGEIAGSFRNVYAETPRYNYAPIFLCIQGLLYRISQIRPGNWMLVYRVMIVSVLTVADLGIAAFIANRYSCAKAVIFFLNPVSIIITGYHNQFDNIAVLFALLSIPYINEDDSFSKKDIFAILFLSLSLMTKHILFLLPVFILLTKNISLKKRIVYAIVPPVVFLLSFIPFAIHNDDALQGIINNVFLYRSFNNAPLLDILYKQIGFPSGPRILVYGIMMLVPAWLVRREKYEYILLIYLIAMVSFSSAIANQYLAIPMAALCVLYVKPWHIVYMIATGIYLLLDGNGLGLLSTIQSAIPGSPVAQIAGLYHYYGYAIAAWLLFFSLVQLMIRRRNGCDLIYGKKHDPFR